MLYSFSKQTTRFELGKLRRNYQNLLKSTEFINRIKHYYF